MEELLTNMAVGWEVAFSAANLLYCFVGVLLGTLIGVLPGLGPTGAIAILLPITYGMHPASAVIMLAGVYYGSQYGGSTTSILVNIPGEAGSVVTCIDGYQMARQGRAGRALGMAALSSFVAGTAGVAFVMLLAKPTAQLALAFGPPELFSLILLAMLMTIFLANDSAMKALIMIGFGVVLSQVGLDLVTAKAKFTLGITYLQDGVPLVPLVMGLFGISEILLNLETRVDRSIFKTAIEGLLPDRKDWSESAAPIARGTVLGFLLGILPGGGAVISSFASYALEKRVSRNPEKFGKGAIEGVAGPEAANNAAASAGFIPLFTLGIPPNSVLALLLAALMVHGLQPGPLLMQKSPEVFWGIVASMYIGNVMLLVLNLPLVGLWVRILRVPYRLLFPLMLFFCVIGAYAVNTSVDDVYLMIAFGVIGYFLRRYGYEPAPLVLAFILGPILENTLRQSLIMSGGELSIFVTRGISAAFLAVAAVVALSSVFVRFRGPFRRDIAKEET
jgi:putative tricarboxylic transport membrane protein